MNIVQGACVSDRHCFMFFNTLGLKKVDIFMLFSTPLGGHKNLAKNMQCKMKYPKLSKISCYETKFITNVLKNLSNFLFAGSTLNNCRKTWKNYG